MDSRERLQRIFAGESADRVGFWVGNPHSDTWPIWEKHFGTTDHEAILRLLNDDFRWICPEFLNAYQHPEGKPIFDLQRKSHDLSAEGYFADCEDVQQVEDFEWPSLDYLNFEPVLAQLSNTGPFYRGGGFWCAFFHVVADFFGMEKYFMKMFLNPEVVHAVTRKVVDFYLAANEKFYEKAGKDLDGFFFGNDFGTQLDLLIGPDQFREFVFPYFREFTEQAHGHGYQVILHSCGSIYKVMPDLIELGVNVLHPVQAKAANMSAETMAAEFKGQVGFMGAIDTQDLLVNGRPDDVRRRTEEVIDLLGPRLVVSPSHECLLPNVPVENVIAMAEAATGAVPKL